MNKIDHVSLLKELIIVKEAEHIAQEIIVKEQLARTYESLKPINLIKNTISQAISSPKLGGKLGNIGMGWLSGFVVKQLIQLGSHNPLVKISATIVEMIVAGKVTQNADDIKAIGAIVLKKIMNHQQKTEEEKISE